MAWRRRGSNNGGSDMSKLEGRGFLRRWMRREMKRRLRVGSSDTLL
jgi:hypothetical protein